MKCLQEYHEGTKCQDNAENEFRTYAKQKVKNCPKCKTRTEKTEGCNKMKCSRCNTNWCWICGKTLPANSAYDHYKLTPKNLIYGCPSLLMLGGQTWHLVAYLISLFLLCPLIYSLGPHVIAFIGSFALSFKILQKCDVKLYSLNPTTC